MKKKLGLEQVLALIKSGLSPAKISIKHSIPKQSLAYYVDKLRAMGCIEKVGYGVWKFIKEVPKQGKGTIKGDSDFSKKEIRGHAFIWKIEFVQPYDWLKAIKRYKKKKLSFSLICKGRVPRTILNNRKIWLTKRGLTIYEPLDFFGRSSFEVKGEAVYKMDRLIKDLLRQLGFKFRNYRFTTSREHYAMVKNSLAKQYNDRKEKMIIRNEEGTAWLWIDNSKGEHELETGDPNISRQVQEFWNDHKKHGFKVGPSVLLESMKKRDKAIQKNAENLDYHAENMKSHVGATRDLSEVAKELNKSLKKQNSLFERMTRALEGR